MTEAAAPEEKSNKSTWLEYPLIDALRDRRSRRFARGMSMSRGPLAFESSFEPVPLTEEEQAILAFAAAGITGPALSDWDWGNGGNMMAGLHGRTVSSADAVQSVALIVMDDDGSYLMRRPQEMEPQEVAQAARLAKEGNFVDAWRLMRVKIADGRLKPPAGPPHNLNPNRWSLHAPGTTYFLPIADLTYFYINAGLEFLNEDSGFFPIDDRNMFLPAGVGKFAKSKGGHLDDDPRAMKTAPISFVESLINELVVVEMGMMLQNLSLACQALGLGGFPHAAADDFTWFDVLGFRMEEMPVSRFFRMPLPSRLIVKLQRQDTPMRYPVGLERDGKVLLKSYTPAYFPSMAAAVEAVVESKLGQGGMYRARVGESAWAEPETVSKDIQPITDRTIEVVTAFAEYVWKRYGRFPANYPAFHTVMGFQASHLDPDFYARYYKDTALSETQRSHEAAWH